MLYLVYLSMKAVFLTSRSDLLGTVNAEPLHHKIHPKTFVNNSSIDHCQTLPLLLSALRW